MRTHCDRITYTCAAIRPLRCANQITRIALREICVRHVGPTGSYFLAQPTHDCACPIPISDRKLWWMDECVDCRTKSHIVDAYRVTRYALSSPYGESQRCALGLDAVKRWVTRQQIAEFIAVAILFVPRDRRIVLTFISFDEFDGVMTDILIRLVPISPHQVLPTIQPTTTKY